MQNIPLQKVITLLVVTANGLGGLKTAASVDLVVSFKAPQNLSSSNH